MTYITKRHNNLNLLCLLLVSTITLLLKARPCLQLSFFKAQLVNLNEQLT